MANLICDIITPERSIFSGECDSVIAPAYDGLLGVRAGHAPFVTELGVGIARVTTVDDTGQPSIEHFAVREGILQIVDNRVTLLAIDAAAAEDLPPTDELDQMVKDSRDRLQQKVDGDLLAQLTSDRLWHEVRHKLHSEAGAEVN